MTMIVKNLRRKNGERTVRRNMLEEEAIGGESMKKNKEKGNAPTRRVIVFYMNNYNYDKFL